MFDDVAEEEQQASGSGNDFVAESKVVLEEQIDAGFVSAVDIDFSVLLRV